MEFQRLDIVQLIHNSPLTKLSNEFQTKLVNKIRETFTEDQQQLFVASFYSYLNYNTKTDFVINLDDIWKWCGFARKDPAKRLIEKIFIKDIDYKIVFHQAVENLKVKSVTESEYKLVFLKSQENLQVDEEKAAPQVGGAGSPIRNLGGSGLNKETILMTINTFKKFCLKAGTKKADEIHDYYIKLEELMQETLKEESEELRIQLEEKDKKIELLEHKPHTHGFNYYKKGYIYLINDFLKPGHYKIGMATDSEKRLRCLNTGSSEKSLRLYYEIETHDIELYERTIQSILQPFNIKGRKEWFYFSNNNQIKYAIHIMNQTKAFLDNFNFQSHEDLIHKLTNTLINIDLPNNNETENKDINEKNIYKLTGQQLKNKTGNYKGVCFCKEKQKFKAELKRDYKISFLGYYDTELDAAKAYNDYALFINNTENTNYTLNTIPNYISLPRDIPTLTKELKLENKTSKFRGVSYDVKRQYYVVSIKYNKKTYNLGNNKSDIECAKLYNQQALFFNTMYGTKYDLNNIPDYITEPNNLIDFDKIKDVDKHSSKYYGVTFSKQANKYKSLLVFNKKQIHLGYFDSEIEAARVYNLKATELNMEHNKKYKLNLNI